MSENSTIPIGEITIAYYLDADGTPIVSTEMPGTDAIPAVKPSRRPLAAPWAGVQAADGESHQCDSPTRQRRNAGLG